jgi:hypothetical protein
MSDTRRQAATAFDEVRREPVARALLAACGATECHLVGGALRDRALGLVTHDLDAIVAGRGREIAGELAAVLPARLVPLGGKEFAAYRLIVTAEPSRRAAGADEPLHSGGSGGVEESVGVGGPERFVLDLWDRESASLEDDLARRDFTVNSFAVDLRGGGVADTFGGLGDLEQRTLRATTRGSFEGDPLRVLRLARLLLRLPGFSAEPETFELARRVAPRLPDAAAERIRDELCLLISHPEAERGLRVLAALGIYPGLWLGSLDMQSGRGRGSAAETAGEAAGLAAAEIAALAGCAAELESLLANRAPSDGPAAEADSPAPAPDQQPAIDLPAARFGATFRYLSPAIEGAVPTAILARMQRAGYLSARQATEIAPLLAEPAELPETELDRRRFLHRCGRRWLTAACSVGGAAAASGAAALDRWRLAAGPLCELALHEGPALIAPPRLIGGDDVQRLLGIAAGPEVGSALAALTAAQVDGAVRSRDDAERFLRAWRANRAS